jgi:hypothetical protein
VADVAYIAAPAAAPAVNPSAPFKPPGAAAAPASGTDDVADEEVMQRLQQAATGDVAPTGKDKPVKKQGGPKPSAAAEKKLAAAEKKRAAADKGGKAGKKAKADKE